MMQANINNKDIEYVFIDYLSPHYPDTILLRYEIFYKSSNKGYDCVTDELERNSKHLVAVHKKRGLLGYGRLTLDGTNATMSQFLVNPKYRYTNVAKQLFVELIKECRRNNIMTIRAMVRMHMTKACKRYGFIVDNEIVTSPKTGIPHKNATLTL